MTEFGELVVECCRRDMKIRIHFSLRRISAWFHIESVLQRTRRNIQVHSEWDSWEIEVELVEKTKNYHLPYFSMLSMRYLHLIIEAIVYREIYLPCFLFSKSLREVWYLLNGIWWFRTKFGELVIIERRFHVVLYFQRLLSFVNQFIFKTEI